MFPYQRAKFSKTSLAYCLCLIFDEPRLLFMLNFRTFARNARTTLLFQELNLKCFAAVCWRA